MSSSSRKHSGSSKLKNVSVTVSFTLVLVGLSLLAYVRSFQVLHASSSSGPVSSSSSMAMAIDTLPMVIAIQQHSHSRTFEDVIVRKEFDGGGKRLDPSVGAGDSAWNSSWQALEQRHSDSLSPTTEEDRWISDNRSSPTGMSGMAETDLQELLHIQADAGRREWLKQHWAEVRILHSDATSEAFPARIKAFLWRQQPRCSQRFFQTWISDARAYGARELRCLESIFKHHPRACVVIVSRSLDGGPGARILAPLRERGYRVMAAAPDLPFLFASTPAMGWFKSLKKGRVDPGEISFQQNLSNILRLALLYRLGGVYLDSDVLLLHSLANLSNAIGAQTEEAATAHWLRLNNAVLVFDRRHPVLLSFIKEFALTFNGSKWGHNGPYLATRVLDRVRRGGGGGGGEGGAAGRTPLPCNVLRTRAFYPVTWSHIPQLFHAPADERERAWKEEKVRRLESESFAIHLWNKQTRGLRVEAGSVIDDLFRRQCVICGDGDRPGATFE